MRRSVHWKRLLIVLLSTAVLSGGLFALNRVQAKRQSSIIRTIAEKAAAEINDDPQRRENAITLYSNYLKFQPTDEQAALKYVRLLLDQYKADPTSSASASAAVAGVELVLRRFPDHPAERRELADIYIKSGQTVIAREHIEVLFNSPKGDARHDPEILEMAAICEVVAGRTQQAIDFLEDAIKTGNAQVKIYDQLLRLLNNEKGDPLRESKIAIHMRTLLEKEPYRDNLEARVAVARFELYRREFENARRDVEYARTRIPGGDSNPDVLLAAAELEMASMKTDADVKPKLAAARALLEKAFQVSRQTGRPNVQVGLYLADVLAKSGEKDQAIAVLRESAKAYGPINDQYWHLIDYLIDLGDQGLSKSLVDRVAGPKTGDNIITYFRGRLALLDKDWTQARTHLEEAAPALQKVPSYHKRAMLGLGQVYGILQNPDQQLNYCRDALRDDGTFLPALIGEAEALAKLGRLEEAITRYQTLVTAYQLKTFRPTLVRLRLLDMIRKPLENRNWSKFDSEDTLGPLDDRSPELSVLYAQSLAARGEREKAIQVLLALLKNGDKDSAIWVALARIQEAGNPGGALAVLDDALKKVGNTVELRLARADVLLFRSRPPAAVEFEELAVRLDGFNTQERYRLYFGLGQACLNAMARVPEGEARTQLQDLAINLLRRAAEADPSDLHCRAVLIDVALITNRREYIEPTISQLERLEGPDGPMTNLARVSVRLHDVRKQPDAASQLALIKELRDLTMKVQKQRPGWGRVYVALGRLDELEGLTDQAVEHYRQALNEGDRDESVIRKAVALYRERKQDAVAASLLDELATKMVLPEDLERFRAIFEMLNRSVPRSERPTIDRIAPANSLDPRILLLRGSLLSAIREDAESLRAFRRAIELAEDSPEAWEALIRQLVRTGDTTSAKKALDEAERKLTGACKTKPPAICADLHIVMGECHEICGDAKTAGARYQEALRLAPQELNPNRRMVEFLLRTGRQADADKMLEALAAAAGQDLARWARRYMALNLVSRPDSYALRARALSLVDRNLALAHNDPQDVKARAVVLTVDPATREEGVRILKEYWAKGELTPDESYHLGMLIYSLGPSKIPEAVKFFESAAKPRPGVTAEHIAGLIRVYVALEKLDIAEATLERLRAAAPFGWDATREEARILMKRSQAATLRGERDDARKLQDQARSLIVKFPGYDTPESIRLRSGPLLAELGFTPEAEELYRKLIKAGDSPTAWTALALLYIQGRKTDEAIRLAQEHASGSPVLLTAQIMSGAVRVKRPEPGLEADVERWLKEQIEKAIGKPEYGGLLASRAELYDARGRYDEAIAEYRRAIKDGANELAVNNLAMLIALDQPQQVDEAIKLITGLIDVRGPIPTYLDTRAVAYIVKGGDATAKAVEDLKMARIQAARAVYAYHLAWAYDLQQNRIERDRLLEEARVIGITSADVHPLEREKFLKLYGPDSK